MWDKIAKFGIQIGKAYIAHRGVNGAIVDAQKVFGWAKKGTYSLFSSNTDAEADELPGLDFEKVQQWVDECIAEMNAAFSEAKRHDITSLKFCQNANIALYTGYDTIAQMFNFEDEIDADDYDTLISTYTEPIDNLCDQILLFIGQKCKGSMNCPKDVKTGSNEEPLCIQVYGVYPVNFDYEMTMLVAVVKNGIVKRGCSITLPGSEDEDTLAEVSFIRMFGELMEEAQSGDLCSVYLKGDHTDTLPNDSVFQIGMMPECPSDCQTSVNTSGSINASEKEYLDEVKACLEDDGAITARERRLLDKLCCSLGISATRAAELEALAAGKPELTESEKEYLDEYKACLEEDGVISERERRLLDRLAKSLNITPEKAREIEASIN